MPRWDRSMEQSFEYYTVDPITWGDNELIRTVTNCTITRDLSNETLGSATIDADEDLNDKYVRVYLITLQNRVRERFPLGTFLCQTADFSYDGFRNSRSYDCYTPLIELKEKLMPIGYTIYKGDNLLARAVALVKEGVRCPSAEPTDTRPEMLLEKNFTSESSDTMLTFITDLLAVGKYTLGLDELSQIIFHPYQELAALRPKAIFNDDNSSILYPEITRKGDIYGIPNVVEVIYSSSTVNVPVFARVVNDKKGNEVSTVTRGREIVFRDTNPSVGDNVTQGLLTQYAKNLLTQKSTLQYELTYSHGFNEVMLNDCVRLNYERAGITGKNAKIIRQVIHCTPGCKVEETAVYTEKMWEE